MLMKLLAVGACLVLLGAMGPVALAAPLLQPVLMVSPQVAAPGQTVTVTAVNLGEANLTNATLCLGMLGPGQNPEQNLSPAFRVGLGQMSVGADGSGEAQVQLPAVLVPGSYRILVGGCPRLSGYPPVSAAAVTELAVVTTLPSPVPGATTLVPPTLVPAATLTAAPTGRPATSGAETPTASPSPVAGNGGVAVPPLAPGTGGAAPSPAPGNEGSAVPAPATGPAAAASPFTGVGAGRLPATGGPPQAILALLALAGAAASLAGMLLLRRQP